MIAFIEITPWHWMGFIVCILAFIALDLGVFRRGARVVVFREALAWSALWFTLAMGFAGLMVHWRGREEATEFATGYLLELSLSLDNILVIVLIFAAFRVPAEWQHRVLTWGVIGAIVLRGVMIAIGAELVRNFSWILYLFGVFLVFTGVKMLWQRKSPPPLEKNPVLRLIRKIFPVTPGFEGQNFFSRLNGKFALTPLALVLLLVEMTDLIFAVDSVPAVFSITRKAFIVFTSNVFAVVGLRSFYFLLAGAIGRFRFLKAGLSVVLVFVGAKMLLDPHGREPKWFQFEISTVVSLLVIILILSTSITVSVLARPERKSG
jgi:tellurite resistance protein TerC